MNRRNPITPLLPALLIAVITMPVMAQESKSDAGNSKQAAEEHHGPGQGRGFGRGMGRGAGMGRGFGRQGFGRGQGQAGNQKQAEAAHDESGHGEEDHAHDERHGDDHEVFQFLLTNHKKIKRTVTETKNGVITVTESDDAEVASYIQEHVYWMEQRIRKVQPIRMRDPLFRELFQHTEKITMKLEDTEKGIRVTETSEDPKVAVLIKAHAKVVSGFVERGFAEAMKNHAVPEMAVDKSSETKATVRDQKITKYGKVSFLPEASMQPQAETQIVVDVTAGGEPGKLFPSIDKLARFVNIYHAAGQKSHAVDLAVVLHGDATLAILNDDAYSDHFNTKGNPNLDCLHELHENGVQIYVCGQSLISKKHKPSEVVVFADVAVSGLTSLANLQKDGYAYVPLK